MAGSPDDLDRVVTAARARLAAHEVRRRLVATLRVALALAVVLLGADKVQRLRFEPWYVIAALLGLAVVAGLALGWRRRPSPHRAALLLDERLGLDERLSSALALRESSYDGPLREPLLADARRAAAELDLRTALPRTWPAETRLCLALALILAALAGLPRVAWWRTETDLATELVSRQVGRELVAKADETARQAAQRQASRAGIEARRVAREALRLRQARLPKEDALRRLEALDRRLQQQREALAGQPLRRSGREARRDLRAMSALGEQVAEQLEDPRVAAAGELLRELAKQARDGQLSQARRQQAADELRRIAEALQGTPHQAQAKELERAAQALDRCDGSAPSREQAAQALEQAAESLQHGSPPDQELLEDLQESIEGGQQALGDAEAIQGEARRNGGQCPEGLCERGRGEGGGAGRAGRSRGPGSTNEAADPSPAEGAAQTPYQPGDSPPDKSQQEWERLYAPRRTETRQHDERVQGRVGQSGGYQAQQGPRQAPRLDDSRVPYYDVLGDYQSRAEEALSRGDIPLTERHRVKRYFDELNAPAGAADERR